LAENVFTKNLSCEFKKEPGILCQTSRKVKFGKLYFYRGIIFLLGMKSDATCLLKNGGFCADRRYNHAVLRRKITFEAEF